MARRGRRGSKQGSSTRSTRPSNPSEDVPLLRHPSQTLSDSRSRKTKSSGPSTTTYRLQVLLENHISITYLPPSSEDIQLLVESLTNMKNTLLSDDNDFLKNPGDPRITSAERMLTVSKDIPSRMREISRRLPGLESQVETHWKRRLAAPLLYSFDNNNVFDVLGGEKWTMIYDSPNEALPLSSPVPDYVCSIYTQLDDCEIDVGIDYALLKKLQEKRIPYSANSSYRRLIYPFLIVEVKSDLGLMKYAENQAGSSAANALTLLRRLRDEARSDKQLPVFVLTSQGSFWQVFVSYERIIRDQRRIEVSKFLLVDITNPEGAHQLMVVLDRIRQWAVDTYIPTIKEMISRVISD